MTQEYISHTEYCYLMNRIAYWLIKNGKKFNTRTIYGYFGREADYGTIIKVVKERGTDYQSDALIAEFIECAIADNDDKSFLPATVTGSDGTKYDKDTYVSMANRVSAYEVNNGKSPLVVYVYNNSESSNSVSNSSSNKLNNYLTNTGCAGMGQCTPYYCGCNSLQQCFYRLTGIHVSESTIASVAGTTKAGTGHQGLNTAVAWFNKKYGKNIKVEWYNFSDLGWDGLEKCMKNGAVFCHLKYRRTSTSAGYGHYEVPYKISGDNIKVLNSLGNKCNKPAYCGYIENRAKSTHKYYIQGISQKSIAYLHL